MTRKDHEALPDYDETLDEAHRRGYIVSDVAWTRGYLAGWAAANEANDDEDLQP